MTEYRTPATIDEALLLGSGEGTAYLGGGTWLNSRPRGDVTALISLAALNLDGVRRENGFIRIGSCSRFQEVLDFDRLPEALAKALQGTASRTLRNMVTIGGDLGLHEPASCVVPALLALDATMILAGEGGEVAIDEYLRSESGGLIVEVRIPDNGTISNLRTLSRTSHSRKSLVCAVSARSANGMLQNLRVVAGDCVADPLRLKAVERALDGKTAPPKQEIEGLVMKHFSPEGDFHAGAAYKRYMAGVIVADIIDGFSAPEARS